MHKLTRSFSCLFRSFWPEVPFDAVYLRYFPSYLNKITISSHISLDYFKAEQSAFDRVSKSRVKLVITLKTSWKIQHWQHIEDVKEFKKDEEEIKMEEIMEEEHVKFTNKAKWTRPKPKINRQATQYVKLGEIDWSGSGFKFSRTPANSRRHHFWCEKWWPKISKSRLFVPGNIKCLKCVSTNTYAAYALCVTHTSRHTYSVGPTPRYARPFFALGIDLKPLGRRRWWIWRIWI